MADLFTEAEMDKLIILQDIKKRTITQQEGAHLLSLSPRHVRRLLKRVAAEGASGLKRRPTKNNNRTHPEQFKKSVISKVKDSYSDFGPTFASEKLWEIDGLKVNKETLRQWMIEEALWKGKIRKSSPLHQSRQRRSRFGELVQIDGSHHDWFEGRRAKCCLLVFVDDATSKIVSMNFEESETTAGYMSGIESHLSQYGRPLAYYSDRHSIFRTTRNTDGYFKETELHRALKDLNIELICAYSSQAKGRVERANQTLQDRLIKEMRLKNISTIEGANGYLPEFIEKYNNKFAVKAAESEDAHRPAHQGKEVLKRILSRHHTRKLSKTLEFSFGGLLYQVKNLGKGYRYQGAQVKIYQHHKGNMAGDMEVLCGDEMLQVVALDKQTRGPFMADRKDIDRIFNQEIFSNLDPSAVLSTGSTAPNLSCN
jgi:hypothetical protein